MDWKKRLRAMSISKKLEEKGLTLSKEEIRGLLRQVKDFAVAQKRTLTDEEVFALVKK